MNAFAVLLDSLASQHVAIIVFSMLAVGGCVSAGALLARWMMREATSSVHVLLGRVTILCLLAIPFGVLFAPSFPIVKLSLNGVDFVESQRTLPLSTDLQQPVHSQAIEQVGSSKPNAPSGSTRNVRSSVDTTPVPITVTQNANMWAVGRQVAIAAWAIVAIGLIVRLLRSHLIVWRLCSEATAELSPALRHTVDATLRHRDNVNRVAVLQSRDVNFPVCVGILRRKVLLPTDIEDLSNDELRCCVEHEYTHALRHDVLWSTLADLIACINWPIPWMWMFRRWLKRDIESACDDGVISHGNDSATYAEMLLGMARRMGGQSRTRAAAISMADHAGFEERVERIIDAARDRSPASTTAVILVVVAGVVCTTLALAVRPGFAQSAPEANATSESDSATNEPISDASEGPLRFGSRELVIGKTTIARVEWSSDAASNQIANLQDVDAVLALDPMSALRLSDGFKSRRPSDRPRLCSIGLTRNVLAKLERAQLDATVSRQPYGLGYRCVEELVRSRMDLLPKNHPPRLMIPARIVTTDQAGYFAGQLREGQKLTMDNRLVDANLTIRMRIPALNQPERNDWWQLAADGATDAAEQFGATLEVVSVAKAGEPVIDVVGFASDPTVLVFPVSSDLGNEINARSFVSEDLTLDSQFVLKTSVERMAEEAARLIVGGRGDSMTLAIVCDESLKPHPESFLPILEESLREIE